MREPRRSAAPRIGANAGLMVGLATLGLVLAFVPAAFGMPPVITRAAILVVFTIAAWAFGFLPEPIVTLTFFLLANLLEVSTPATIFSGFQSTAWWLVFGGAITGIAVQTSGLGSRWARVLFARAGATYRNYVTAAALASLGLAFVMPSTTGRILLLMPLVLALAERLGLKPGSNGHQGLVMTVAAGSYMPPATILPANIPNSVLLGAAESLYGVKLTYGPYLLLHFPILGLLKTAILIALVCQLYPEAGPLLLPLAEDEDDAAARRRQRVLAVVLAASLLLFATDVWHGISPAWISLWAGLVCLMPFAGVVSVKMFGEKMSLTPLVYVAGFLGLGAVVTETGLGKLLGGFLLRVSHVVPGDTAANVVTLAAIGAAIGAFTTLPGLPAVLSPLAADFSRASGLPLLSVLMLQVVVFSTVILPYQAPPMMIAMHLGGVPIQAASKLCLSLAAITVVVLLPLDYLWWKLLGYV